MSNESPDLTTLEAQLTASRIRTAEAEAAHTETLNEGDKLRARIDCGVSPRDGCLNPERVCLMCQFASANRMARERTKEACDLTVQLADAVNESARRAEYIRELAKEHSAALDREQQVRNELAAARAELKRVQVRAEAAERDAADAWRWRNTYATQWLELCNAAGVLSTSRVTNDRHLAILHWIQQVRAERLAGQGDDNTSLRTELEQERATSERVLRENNDNCVQQVRGLVSEIDRLRAALAQVGEKVKAEAVRVLEYQLQMTTENEASDGTQNGLGIAIYVISNMNIAAIVAASAETTERAASSDPVRPCCSECNEEKNLAYLQTNAEAEEWLCKTCGHRFQFKPARESNG